MFALLFRHINNDYFSLIRYILAMRNLALSTAVGEHGDLGPLVQLLVDAEDVMLKVKETVMPKWVPSDLPPLPKL